jgi:predicted ATP-dependent endonuclease of OLD family
MIIESITIKNFRSVLNETISLCNLTALIGRNGAGKSAFLHALNIFYSTNPVIAIDDFYNREVSNEIIISIKYKNLSDEALRLFNKYVENDSLTVERVITWNEGKVIVKFHGSILQNPEFDEVKSGFEIKDRGVTAKNAYNILKENQKYQLLPPWSNLDNMKNVLRQWEEENSEQCIRKRDDGQFFGFTTVAAGYLGRFTRYIFIPAVRDASLDAIEARGSVLTILMELVVRSLVVNKEMYIEFQTETQKKYEEIMNPNKLVELNELAKNLTDTLKIYVPDTEVELSWLPIEKLNIPVPKADIKLIEDNFSSTVDRTGHGLQRAFILTMLQYLTLVQKVRDDMNSLNASLENQNEKPISELNILLAIEEPELYQHPNRQKYLFKIFQKLSEGVIPGVVEKTQIIYTTHSPLFVSVDKVDQIRLLRKIKNLDNQPKITKVYVTNLDEIAELIWIACDKPGEKYIGKTLLPKLKTIITPNINEGFFADVAVLVEGEEDRSAILGTSEVLNIDFDSLGISVIACNCKNNIDRPTAIFNKLGIPTFIIWDGDKGKDRGGSATNKILLRLQGKNPIDWPPDCVGENYACFENDLGTTMKKEIGDILYNKLLEEYKKEFSMAKNEDALKNPIIIKNIINGARNEGKKSEIIEKIIKNIVALKENFNPGR